MFNEILKTLESRQTESAPLPPLFEPSNTFPRYRHDCSRCTFLGNTTSPDRYDGIVDLYFCPQMPNVPTIIARHSSASSDYSSGISFGKDGSIPELAVAYNLAQARGYL